MIKIIVLLACVLLASAKLHAPFQGNFEDLPTLQSADLVGAGFNAKTGQSGLMAVLSWTYQFNQTWQSPTSGIVYKVPDQLTLADQSETMTKVCFELSYSFSVAFNAYLALYAFAAAVPVGSFSLAVNYDHELAKISLMTQSDLNIYSSSTHFTTVYSLVLPPAYVLSPSHIFLLAVAGLPASYSSPSDLQKYQEFVTAYGTHYICLADLGGRVDSNSFLSKTISSQHSLTDVSTQMSLKFSLDFFKFSTGGFQNRSQISLESWFAANVQSESYWVGGSPATQTNTTLDAWIESIPDVPGLLNTTLCSITELVSDQGTAATLLAYINQYIAS